MFLGEGPGRREDETGRPFVGLAGRFLGEMLESINLQRADVFITNVVKCRPPQNRDPEISEVEACSPWLKSQIAAIAPRVLVLLGRHALNRFLPGRRIGSEHGRLHRFGELRVMPMYHPAAALHNPRLREICLSDFSRLADLLDGPAPTIAPAPEAAPEPSMRQSTLF